ncbi:MAG: internalin, putative [Cytophagales bacterium]|jgi:gliding motility-associated-like protein|nr:gliding motility-associated C-terminal domain-containing protein [Bacteroidota bacterium]MBS1982185.1 gliding motility-associated C-terminal domain-containing protein [Bacteroidota bacterium]WHZ09527.1 MAG: internalin, putative [Cytophagales bacterium]
MTAFKPLHRFFQFTIYACLFFLGSTHLFAQTATVVNIPGWPRYESFDQQSVSVWFDDGAGGAVTLTGTSSTAQWTVTVNGTPVTIVTTVPYTGATVYPIVSGAAAIVRVAFDASVIAGHPAWVLPGDVVKISFTNTGGTLKTGGSGNNAANFSNITCKNNYTPTCADVNFLSYGTASSPIQCAPVDTKFWRWTYRYSLRWRNSSKFVIGNENLVVQWNNPAATVSNLKAWYSDAGGTTWYSNVILSNSASTTSSAYAPAANPYPEIFLTYRSSFNPATGVLDGTNSFIYPKGSGLCNFNAISYPFNPTYFGCNVGQNLKSQEFISNDWDNQNPGVLNSADIPPTGVGGFTTTDQVCLGTNVGAQFSDASTFNCMGNGTTLPVPTQGAYTGPVNNAQRWVRIIYGGQNSSVPANNIPNIVVNGFAVTGAAGALNASLVGNPAISNAYNLAPPVNTPPVPATVNGYVVTGAGGPGVPDANGVIQLNVPANATTSGLISQLITTSSPLGQVVGQKFYITIQYWNACNPYPGNNPVEYTGTVAGQYVQIVTAPAPLASTGRAVCYDGTNNISAINFTTTSSIGGSRLGVNWYKSNPQTGGTAMTNPNGTNSLTFPANRYTSRGGIGTFAVNNSNGGYYSLWATQTAASGSSTCESTPVEVVIFQQPNIGTNTPSITSGPTDVCNNTTQAYTSSAPTTPKTLPVNTFTNTGIAPENGAINFITDDFWSQGFGAQVSLSATQGTSTNATFSLSPQPATFTNNNITVNLQYTGSPVVNVNTPVTSPAPPPPLPANYSITPQTNCPNNNTNVSVNVWGVSNGGSISVPSQTICEGTNPAAVSVSGIRGNVQNWQMQVNGGGFSTNAALGTGNTATISAATVPIVGGAQTTYQFYAVVKNGPVCTPANSPTATIIVNPRPTNAVLSGTTTICKGNSTNLTVAITGGVSTYSVVYNDGSGNITVNGYVSGSNIPVSPSVNTTYTLVSVTDANGCTSAAVSGTATVTVRNLSAVLSSTGPTSLCPAPVPGNSTTIAFTVTDNNGNALTTYNVNYQDNLANLYNTGAGYVSGSNVTLSNIVSSRTFSITNITDPLGCTTNPNTGSVAITVGSAPSSATFSGGGSVCLNGSLNLKLVISGGVSPYQVTIPGINGGSPFAYTSGNPIAVPTSSTGTINYSATVITDACGAPLPLASISGNPQSVTVNPLPVANNSIAAVVCSQTNLNINTSANITNGVASTFAWTAAYTGGMTGPASGTGNITGVVVNKTSAVQTATFTVTPTSVTGSCPGANFTITQTVNPEPVSANQTLTALCSPATVTINPQTQGVNQPGGNNIASTFTWTGSYGALTGGVASGSGNITGFALTNSTGAAINAVFTVTPTANTGSCVGSNFTITLPVNPLANISSQPVNDTKCSGQNSSFSVTATGPGLSYQWQVSTDGGATWSNLSNGAPYSNVTTSTLNLTGVTVALNAYQYRCVVTTLTNGVSCPANTTAATLTVNPLPTSTDPLPQLCEDVYLGGSHANVDLTSYNASVTNAPTVAWYNDAGHTSSVGTPTSVTVTNGKVYYFVATSAATCINTGTLTFTVNPLPQAVTKNYSYCEDHSGATPIPPHSNSHAGIDLTSYNTTIAGGSMSNRSVAWYSDAALTTLIPSPNNYTLAPVLPATTITVYAKVTNTVTGCTNSANVNLTILPRPIDNPISGNASVCTGTSTILYQVDPTLNIGSNYTWSVVGTPPSDVTLFAGGGTNSSNFFVLLRFPSATGTVALSVFETLNGCSGNTQNMTINVNSAPSANTINGVTQVCTNQTAVPYAVASPNVTSNYTWTVSPDASNAGSVTANGSAINVNFGVISPVTITVVETASSGCVGAPANIGVTVNPRPAMTSATTASVCSGQVPSLVFTSNIASTYAWTVTNITGGITGVTNGQSGNGDLSSTFTAGVLRNKSGAVGSVTFNVTPTASAAPNCQGTTQSVVLTVNPEPVLVNPQTATICSGSAVNYTIQLNPLNLPPGTVYSWPLPTMSDASVQGSAVTSMNVPITDVLNNTSSGTITATYAVTPVSGGGCTGATQNVVVTVNPQPAMNAVNTQQCSGTAIGVSFTKTAGSPIINNYNITSVIVPGGLVASGSNAVIPANGVSATYISNDSYLNTTLNPLIVQYTVVPTTSAGCLGSPTSVNITINPQPSLSATLDKTLCSELATGLTLSTIAGSVPATGYNITGITIAPGLVAGGSNAVVPASNVAPGYLASDQFTNTGNAPLTVVYQVVPVSALGCNGNPPKSITMTILPEPVVANGLSGSKCSGIATGLTLNTNGTSVAAANYNITTRTIAPGLVASGANAVVPAAGVPASYLAGDVFTNTTSAALAVTYTVVPISASPCTGQPKIITITINPEPVMSPAGTSPVCSRAAIGLALNTNGTSVGAASYNITARSISAGLTPNVANAAVPASAVPSNYLAADVYTNTGANPLTVTYTVVPVGSIGGCLGQSQTIIVTINPEPVMSSSLDGTVCSIVPIGLTLNTNGSSVAANTYNITAISVDGGLTPGSNAVVPASNVAAGYLTNDTYTNTGTVPLNVVYTVVPVSGAGCSGNPLNITLKVNPMPIVSNGLNKAACSGAAVGLTLNTNGVSVAAANYNISSVSVDPGLTAGGGNAVIPANNVATTYLLNDKYTNTGNTSLPVVYTVVPISAAGCPGPSQTITITINPEPVVSGSLGNSVCSSTTIGLLLNTNGSSVAAANYNITGRTVAGGLTPKGTNVTVPASAVAANYLAGDIYTNTTTLPLNVTYTAVAVSGAGCVGQPVTITIVINPEPVLSNGLNATLCSSTATGLTLATNGTSVGAASYNVTNISLSPGLTASGGNAVIPSTGVANNYLANDQFINVTSNALTATYSIVPVSASGCVGAPVNVVMTINPQPVVSSLLNNTVCSDVATGLTLSTNGTSVAALNYNITVRTIAPGLVPAGANATVPATGVAASYLSADKFNNITTAPLNVAYTVVPVSGANCAGTPMTITITINPKPVLNVSPVTQCSGVATGLLLATSASSVTAQNYNITAISIPPGLTADGTNAVVPASGVNANYLAGDDFTNTGAGDLTVTYTVVPVSSLGCAGQSMPIGVTIHPQPVVATTLNNTLCSRSPVNLVLATNGTSVAAANYNITAISIQAGLVAGGSNAAVPATGVVSTYLQNDTYTNTTNSALTVSYTVVPVSAAGCLGNPQVITMTINAEPVVSTFLNNTVCSQANIGLTLNTNGSSASAANYSITARNITAGLTPSPSNVIVPATNVAASYLALDKYTNTGGVALSVTYTVVPFSAAGCQGQPQIITIMINPEPVIPTLDAPVCSSVATGLLLTTNGTSVAATSYNIVSITVGGTLVAAGGNAVVPATGVAASYLASDVFKNIDNFSQTVTYVVAPMSGASCLGGNKTITLTINPEPVGNNFTDPQCATTLNHSIVSQITNGVNSVFTYTVATNNPGVPPAANRTVASAANITDNYVNNTGSPATLTYTITPFSSVNNCQGQPFNYIVVINPTPVGANNTQAALCSHNAFTINPQSQITNGVTATFAWTAVYDAGLTGGTGTGSGNIADNLTNLTGAALNATYTITPSAGPCSGTTFTIIQPINPEPVMDPTLSPKTICSNNATSPNPTNIVLNTNGTSVAATSYNVSLVSQDAGLTGSPTTGTTLGANAIKNDVYNNVGPVSLKVVYQIIPKSAAGCTGAPFNISVTVNPEPVVAALSNTVCSRDVSNVLLTTNGTSIGALNYQLKAVTVPGTITANPSNTVVGTTSGVSLIKNDSYTNTTSGAVTVTYSILGISASGCQGLAQTILVTINPEPIMVPGLATVCSNVASGVVLGPAGGSAAISQYNLNQILTPGGLTPAGTNVGLGTYSTNNFLANDVFTNTTNSPLNVVYTIVPVTASLCKGLSQTVTLTVNPAPALAGLNTTVCSTSATNVVFATTPTSVPAASPNGYNITNIVIQAGLTQTAGNTGSPRNGVTSSEIQGDKFTNSTNGTLTVTYTVAPVSTGGCVGPTGNIVVTVEPTIKATVVPASLTQSICSNTQTNIALSSPTIPSTGAASISFSYTATSSLGGSISGFIPAVSNLPPGTITDNLVNTANNAGTVTYAITAVSNGAAGGSGCSSQAVNFVVTVDPLPKLIATPLIQTVCSQVPSNVVLTSPTNPSAGTIRFNVISSTPTGGMVQTAPAVPAAFYTVGQSIKDAWNNTTVSQQTVAYVLQPVVNGGLGCVGNNTSITLNVNPLPVLTATSQAPICSDSTVNISLSSNVIGTINTWTTSIAPLGSVLGAGGGSGDLIMQSLRNTGSVPSTVTYTITPKAANCTNTPVVVNVTVNPTPTILALPATQVVCYGAPLNIPLTSAVTGVNYAWTVDPNNSGVPLSGSASGAGANSSAAISIAAVSDTLSFSSDSFGYYITPTGPAPTFCPGLQKTVNIQAGAQLKAKFLNDPVNNICAGTKDFLQVQLNGQAPFTLVYNDGSNVTLTKVSNFKAIPISPTTNTTYNLVSMKDNLGCPQSLTGQVIYNVFPQLTAAFTVGTVPQFSGGNSTVTFTNTSTPQDAAQYSYVWNFGVDSAPDSVNNIGPNFSVNYSSPGRKIISLTVTNLSPNAAGLSCSAKMTTQTINILVAPVVAAFQATPPAACFPSSLTVTQNTSGGDESNWQVTDKNNNIVGQSTAPLPVFTITQPGEYYISLTAVYSKTGQHNTLVQGPFIVYDKPQAVFLANPPTVYVPDTPMKLINNSFGATEFNWDFGDGNNSTDFEPTYTYKFPGVFTISLIASNDHGGGIICRDTSQQKILAKQGGVAKIPNAFTPSTAGPSGGISGGTNDANNYIFLPQVKGVEEFNLQIYDRWGNLIFESNNQTVGWDGYDQNGRLMHAGVYVYKLTLRLSDQQRTTQVGDVTLIR